MLVYKSESWANGEKPNEKSWCAMTVADCSKSKTVVARKTRIHNCSSLFFPCIGCSLAVYGSPCSERMTKMQRLVELYERQIGAGVHVRCYTISFKFVGRPTIITRRSLLIVTYRYCNRWKMTAVLAGRRWSCNSRTASAKMIVHSYRRATAQNA